MSEQATSRPMNPTAIAVVDAARLLSAAGGHPVTPEQIQADIEAGLPTNPDGTINLVRYAAWLTVSMGRDRRNTSGSGMEDINEIRDCPGDAR